MTGYTIYTDGTCFNNGQPGARAGWGAYLINPEGKTLRLAAPVPRSQPQTNNRAELLAAIKALARCNKPGPIRIYSDSQLLVKGCNEWLQGWKRNGWRNSKRQEVEHRDLWEKLDQLIQARQITFVWVRGHSGNPGNEEADALANRGAAGEVIEEYGCLEAAQPA